MHDSPATRSRGRHTRFDDRFEMEATKEKRMEGDVVAVRCTGQLRGREISG